MKEKEPPPVVVDLGEIRKKDARALRDGEGPIMEEIDQVVSAVRESLTDELEDHRILPLVVLYRQERENESGSILDC